MCVKKGFFIEHFSVHMRKTSALILTVLIVSGASFITACAASYSGKGTKSNPFLVQTYEQLQGMKDNLSAHYKLANTIDCSGQTLQPIGFLAQPFTGSFTCDKNADGTPKFAIKNLKVSVQESAYSANNSKWEAGLFGCTSGATISNIAVLNATINNAVIGKNQMNPDWSKNPGQDEQASGILIGIAKKTKVKYCVTTGNVDVKTNHVGGLIGRAQNSTVEYCYSTATVSTTGLWCVGGLIGSSVDGTVSYSYATGNVVTLATGSGGLIGDASSAISNCYSTGAVGKSSAPAETGSLYGFGGNRSEPKSCSDSYSTSVINGLGKSPEAASTSSGCYVLNEANRIQGGFQPASAAEIASIFGAKSGWTLSGGTATIKDIAVITNEAAYTPGAVDLSTATENTANTQGNAGTAGNADSNEDGEDNTSSSEEKKYTADEMTEKVDTLMEELMSKKGLSQDSAFVAVTLKDELAKMDPAEAEKLPSGISASVDMLYDGALTVLISTITEEIDALPEPKNVNSENADKVLKVWEKYQKLPEDLQDGFTEVSLDKLKKCYKAAKQYENVQIVSEEVDSAVGTLQIILIVLLSVLNLAALAGVIIMITQNVRIIKKIGSVDNDNIDGTDTDDE